MIKKHIMNQRKHYSTFHNSKEIMEKFMRVHFNFGTKGKKNLVIVVKEKRFRHIITHHVINIGRNVVKKENQQTIECLETLVHNLRCIIRNTGLIAIYL